jgi:hypothetical protein
VLKGVAWVTLMALLTLVSVDRVVCADGCTDSEDGVADGRTAGDAGRNSGAGGGCDRDCDSGSGGGQATVPAHPHSCVLCTTGLEAPVALPTLSPLGIIGRLTVAAPRSAASIPPPLLDHPPRSFAG